MDAAGPRIVPRGIFCMDAETHRKITETVARWLALPAELTESLMEGSVAPDRSPDYWTSLTASLTTKRRRIRHHGTPFGLLKRTVAEARQIFLKSQKLPVRSEAGWLRKWLGRTRENLACQASHLLGRALHYIQDNTVFPYAEDRYTHDSVERGMRRLNPSSCVKKTQLHRLVGKMETYQEIDSVEAADKSSEAMRKAVTHTFAIVSSVLSSSEAPPRLNTLGNSVYRFFKTRQISLLVFSILLVITTDLAGSPLNEEASFTFGLLVGIPSICLSLLGLGVALLMDINTVLQLARWMYPTVICLGAGSAVTVLSVGQLAPATPLLLVISYHYLFLQSPAWSRIRNDVYWFTWTLQDSNWMGYPRIETGRELRTEIETLLKPRIRALGNPATYRTLVAEIIAESEFMLEQIERRIWTLRPVLIKRH